MREWCDDGFEELFWLYSKWHPIPYLVHNFWCEPHRPWSKVVHYKGYRVPPFGADSLFNFCFSLFSPTAADPGAAEEDYFVLYSTVNKSRTKKTWALQYQNQVDLNTRNPEQSGPEHNKPRTKWTWTQQTQNKVDLNTTNPEQSGPEHNKPRTKWTWTEQTQNKVDLNTTNPEQSGPEHNKPRTKWTWTQQTQYKVDLNTTNPEPRRPEQKKFDNNLVYLDLYI
jgi:hypothetical protein